MFLFKLHIDVVLEVLLVVGKLVDKNHRKIYSINDDDFFITGGDIQLFNLESRKRKEIDLTSYRSFNIRFGNLKDDQKTSGLY